MDKDMFLRRREKLDLFKAFRNKTVQVKEKDVPDDLYTKCPGCGASVLTAAYRENLRVCPECGHHGTMGVRDRIVSVADEGTFKLMFGQVKGKNPLDFPDYDKKMAAAEKKTGLSEAAITGICKIGGHKAALAVLDSRFFMGSMSSAVGERVTRITEYAAKKKLPLIIFSASGGARMQEGIFSLMQMAKTSAALARFAESGGLYISVLTHPTTGGVTASFASLGDIMLAEPGALIGFAGPRVIEQTIKQKLPEGFQRSEFLQDCGFVDEVVPRSQMKQTLSRLLKLHSEEVRLYGR